MKYIETTIVFIGIWFIAALLNGVLCGIYLTLSQSKNNQYEPNIFALAVLFSFLFSIPFVGVVWFVATIAQLAGTTVHKFYQLILSTALITAFTGAVFFIGVFKSEFKNETYAVAACIVVSALTAVLLFHKAPQVWPCPDFTTTSDASMSKNFLMLLTLLLPSMLTAQTQGVPSFSLSAGPAIPVGNFAQAGGGAARAGGVVSANLSFGESTAWISGITLAYNPTDAGAYQAPAGSSVTNHPWWTLWPMTGIE